MKPLLPTSTLATCTVVLLVLSSLSSLVVMVLYAPFSLGESTYLEDLEVLMPVIGFATLGRLVSSWLLLPLWFGLSVANLRRLGVVGLSYTPVQAWSGFYIPFVNMIRPYRALKEIWHASDPGLVSKQRYDRTGWLATEGTPLLTVFWIAFVLSWVFTLVPVFALLPTTLPLQVIANPLAEAVSVAALVFLMVQIERRRRVMQTSLDGAPPLASSISHTPNRGA